MHDIKRFTVRVSELLTHADHEPHWAPGEAEQYMAAVDIRRKKHFEIATSLVSNVIRPRLEVIAKYFPNAAPAEGPDGTCSYWFGYTERFPATTKVSITVGHDAYFSKLEISYEAAMIPLFIKLNERDKIAYPLEEVTEDAVADWIESRLLDFLDAYLRIDRGGSDFDDEAVTDPVCSMRIQRSAAVASDNYRGHSYFFCSAECQTAFTQAPETYVDAKGF